jgi:acid phosphatase (class A)
LERFSSYMRVACVAALVGWPASESFAQQIETSPPPAGTAKAQPYLAADSVDYHLLLAPPPLVGSARDITDRQAIDDLQKDADAARWQTAEQDAQYVYARFAEPLGQPLDRATLPLTIHLLNRALRDVVAPAFAAKEDFQRPRPFQRFQLARVCGEAVAPVPEVNPTKGASYPSGHSAYGWTTALILAQIAPDRAPQLLEKASEYAESRLICGMHFPTDIEAGRVLAVAIVERLKTVPAFEADLASARVEFPSVNAGRCPH